MELGRRITENHLLRKISKIVDFGFVWREVSGFYGGNRHVSADPVVTGAANWWSCAPRKATGWKPGEEAKRQNQRAKADPFGETLRLRIP